jgi:hypothetical protein
MAEEFTQEAESQNQEQTQEGLLDQNQTQEQSQEGLLGNKQQQPNQEREQVDLFNPDEVQPPEGIVFDEVVFSEFSEIAKETGLSKEQGEKLLDVGVKLQQRIMEQHIESLEKQASEWAEEIRNDKEIGQNLDENLSYAKKAMETYFGAEVQDKLEAMGVINHPDLIRGLVKIGKTLREDSGVGGEGAPNGVGRIVGQSFYEE